MKRFQLLESLIHKNPTSSASLIKEFLDVYDMHVSLFTKNEANINDLFNVYKNDPTKDKWIFFGLIHYIVPLTGHEMVTITDSLTFHHSTIDTLRKEDSPVSINDVILIMHHLYNAYEMSTFVDDKYAWFKFSTTIGGNILAPTIIYLIEKDADGIGINHRTPEMSVEDIQVFYKGLVAVMKQDDFEKIKIYIDYSLV